MTTTAEELLARVRARRDLPPPDTRKAIREAAGVSQQQCAEALHVSQAGFASWECGRRTPRSNAHLLGYAHLLTELQQEMAA